MSFNLFSKADQSFPLTYLLQHLFDRSHPAQIWSGNGYHFMMPMDVPVLEKISDFNGFVEPSRRLMHFLEKAITNNEADNNHTRASSFNNLMLRVPGTLNRSRVKVEKGRIIDIPYEAIVRLDDRWDGNVYRAHHAILTRFYIWLEAEKIKKIERQRAVDAERRAKYSKNIGRISKWDIYTKSFDYIGRMLDKPVLLHNYCIWGVIVPYLKNIKGLKESEISNIVNSWLDKCSSLTRLKFYPVHKIEYELDHVGTYWPVSRLCVKRRASRAIRPIAEGGSCLMTLNDNLTIMTYQPLL